MADEYTQSYKTINLSIIGLKPGAGLLIKSQLARLWLPDIFFKGVWHGFYK